MNRTNFLKTTIGLIVTTAVVLFFNSCADEPNNNNNGINQVFKNSVTPPQIFTINSNVNSTVIGAQGTIVNIPAGSFETMGGAPVTGTVSVYLTEVYDNNQMLLNQKPTVSGTQMLLSGGAIKLSATQGGNQLVLSSSVNVQMPVSNTSVLPSSNMQLFYWDRNDSTANPTDSTWVPQDSSIAPVDSSWTFDSIPANNPPGWYYHLNITEFNWINCDQFWGYPNIEEIQADAPSGYSYADTRVYLVLTSINSVAYMYEWGCAPYEFCTGASYAVPVGYPYAIASIHYDSGTSSYTSSIVTGLTVNAGAGNNVVVLTYSPTTIAQFEADVAAL